MRVRKGLKTKTPLKARTPLKAKAKPAKQPKPTLTKLRKLADDNFSWYVRLRDSEREDGGWYGTCITCSKYGQVAWIDEKGKLRFNKGWDAGHFIGRGNWFLRYDEENVNLQCSFRCNKMRSGEPEKYKMALDKKYGDGTYHKLEQNALEYKNHKLRREDFELTIQDAKVQVDFMRSL